MTSYKMNKEHSYPVIEEIKRQIKIEDVLNQYGGMNIKTKLYNRKSYNIKCPFHDDRSPSFTIWPQTDSWKCHAGCGSGDVINLFSKFHNISNTEARIMLQKQLGIINKWSAIDYSNWQNNRKLLRGFKETRNQIVMLLQDYRNLFNKVMKQVVSYEDIDKILEVYHAKPIIEKYLEDLNSRDFQTQVATVKRLKPLLNRRKNDE